jgi:hypothetical protein
MTRQLETLQLTDEELVRFYSYVIRTDDDGKDACWLWNGGLSDKGYGRIKIRGIMMRAHKVSYLHYKGPIEDGLTVDHTCRLRPCVRPKHLVLVTDVRNTQLAHIRMKEDRR